MNDTPDANASTSSRPALPRRQLVAILLLVLLGAIGAVAILNRGPARPDAAAAATEEASDHDHDHGHGHVHVQEQDKTDRHDGPAGLVALTDAQLAQAGAKLDTAGPAPLRAAFTLSGEIRFNEDRTSHVVPRVAGVVDAVPVALGQQVRQGQVLAVLSSPAVSDQRAELQAARKRLALASSTHAREQRLWEKISPLQDVQQAEQALREAEIAVANAQQKLQAVGASTAAGGAVSSRFEIRAPFDGTLVEKHIALGEHVNPDTNVFTLSDLRTVWAQINVPAKDLAQVRLGETVTVRSTAFEQAATGTVAYVGALLGEQTRTATARVTLQNPQAAWRPGLFVDVEVQGGPAATVPVTVQAEGVQTMEGRPVVFVKVDGGYRAQPVRTGRSDGHRIEILEGLAAGTRYVGEGSFIVKSEAGKSAATHSH